jgi:hypothetical protein
MKNIHLIPTDKPSRLRIGSNFNFVLGLTQSTIVSKNDSYTNQHIYITNDEEIKKGDWHLYENEIQKTDKKTIEYINSSGDDGFLKIILTTDQDLIADGVQAIDDEFLEWFVKNPSCEEVEIENWYNKYLSCCRSKEECYCNKKRIIIPQEEHSNQIKCYCGHTSYCDCSPLDEAKQETLEEFALKNSKYTNHSNINHSKEEAIILGAKWQQERMYSEEDLRNAYRWGTTVNHGTKEHFNELFEQFKKK